MECFQVPVKKLGNSFKRYGEWVSGDKSRPWHMLALGIAVVLILTPGMLVAAIRDAEELDTEDLFTPRTSTGMFSFSFAPANEAHSVVTCCGIMRKLHVTSELTTQNSTCALQRSPTEPCVKHFSHLIKHALMQFFLRPAVGKTFCRPRCSRRLRL